MFNAQFIDEYSKKILAFAYDKTGNIYDAEDLSQEILMALFISIPKYSKIENMDGFVYTICHHCWSNFCRKNKKHWNHADIFAVPEIQDDWNLQNEVENAVLIEKMKREVAYLAQLHRDIIVKTYYDGKSSAQISKELNISDSTIRWHLVETRKKLKRRIEMDNHENLNYKPIALNAGWSGENCKTMRGIGQYRLVDNILYVCYGEPLTIEEISQKLSVAAAFVEPHIEELVYMDDMKQIGADKYQTNIFIRTKAFLEIEQRYTYDNIGAKADKIYEAIEKRFDKIKDINFVGSDLDKDFLLWILICYQTERLERKAKNIISKTKEFLCCTPKRKDGSEHYVRAFLQEDDYVSPMPEEVQAFGQKCDYCISNAWAPHEISSYQIVSYATIQAGDRNILWGNALKQIQHIVKISKNDLAPDKYTETLIAEYAKSGLMKVDGGKIKILMPYLTKNEYEKLDEILLEAEAKLGEDFFVDYIEGYMKKAKTQIPDFLPDNEKNYVVTGISCVAPVPYYLSERGKLRYPTDEEAKRLGIIVWELT